MCKEKLCDKRSKTVNSQLRIATSTAKTLTAVSFSLKSPGGGIKIPCTYILIRVSTLFPSQKFSYRAYLQRGGELIRGVKYVLGKCGWTGWAYLRGSICGGGFIGGEIRYDCEEALHIPTPPLLRNWQSFVKCIQMFFKDIHENFLT